MEKLGSGYVVASFALVTNLLFILVTNKKLSIEETLLVIKDSRDSLHALSDDVEIRSHADRLLETLEWRYTPKKIQQSS